MVMNKFVQLMTVTCACLAMAGCMTMQPLNVDPAQLSGTLKRGDKVDVVTSSGQKLQFAIDSVDQNGLQGGGQRIAYNDIRSISRNQVDVGRTALIALGVVAAGAAAAAGGGGGGSSGY
jgi:hypothetical protein